MYFLFLGICFLLSNTIWATSLHVERLESQPGATQAGSLAYWQVNDFEGVEFPIHVIRVDLKAPEIRVSVSAESPAKDPDSGKAITREPKAAAHDAGMVAAINANAFAEGSGVLSRIAGVAPGKAVELYGDAMANGVFFPGKFDPYAGSLWSDADNVIHVAELEEGALAKMPGVTNAVTGFHQLIRNSKVLDWGAAEDENAQRIARTAAGISNKNEFLYLVVAEGKHGVFSKSGFTEPAIARFMASLGCVEALMFDGGGSSSMVADFGDGLELVNHPADRLTRPVPVMLGVVGIGEEARSK
ncbi:phosphodiester glycosidase family protein [Rubellicoccus peritrichatus]|uniref:Phosphodiester glycosidase family protein n=1 Tax=Rubellicoccus peritrichatus TaxID=3080537 RepID=A0AAQ3QT34_9BACT|nr:phosphodiester glycosidase family protein [Puniceicoccus sp. CR14]WOO40876.1 phosphodiester glycosidase family protein [Puniceicoccus sp. CR14]